MADPASIGYLSSIALSVGLGVAGSGSIVCLVVFGFFYERVSRRSFGQKVLGLVLKLIHVLCVIAGALYIPIFFMRLFPIGQQGGLNGYAFVVSAVIFLIPGLFILSKLRWDDESRGQKQGVRSGSM